MSTAGSTAAEPSTATSPIEHLYFFDDLTYHLRRIADEMGIGRERTDALVDAAWGQLTRALGCIDHAHQDYVLVNWDHACAQLSYTLAESSARFDVIASQGCNGDYALASLASYHAGKTGVAIAERMHNVRIAHYLNDPDDPFFSDFTLETSRGPSLAEQCATVARAVDEVAATREGPVRLAIFDDCIQTGEGTWAVAEGILGQVADGVEVAVSGVAFIGCEATMNRLRAAGWTNHLGVLLRGETYPAAWKWDVYFLKDLFLDNAVRYADGTSVAYMDGGWFDKIFPGDPAEAQRAFRALRALLEEAGVYARLEAM